MSGKGSRHSFHERTDQITIEKTMAGCLEFSVHLFLFFTISSFFLVNSISPEELGPGGFFFFFKLSPQWLLPSYLSLFYGLTILVKCIH